MADRARIVQEIRGDRDLTVRESITVKRPVAEAFRLFTDGIGDWWPLKGAHSYGGERADKIFLEAKPGGRFYERFSDGEEFEVGRVIACDPPHRIVFTWRDPDWDGPTEVEVRFSPVAGATRVDLEHRGWETAGPKALKTVPSWQQGWKAVLAPYGAADDRTSA
jgi:uncharacterized protein YndB with AHSA1/START domain